MKPNAFICKILTLLVMSLSSAVFFSCEENEDEPFGPDISGTNKQTVLMYMPWSGSSIYSYFLKNISSFETAIENNHGLDGNSLIVFISENGNVSHMIRITYDNGVCRRDTLKQYYFSTCDYTTAAGITSIINDAISAAPAQTYAMAIGCHGMGWIQAGTTVSTRAKMASSAENPIYLTRYFGHSSDPDYETDIETLAEGIEYTGLKMKYVLFDDCYMSNIETVYDMRNATDYMIASTCEIMIDGMPYADIGIDLLTNNLKGVCEGFYNFYSNFSMPCGTIGITDCNEVEQMAAIMYEINKAYPDGLSDTDEVQDLDGYDKTIFFDFGDYVSHLCTDQSLLTIFNEQLERLVPYKANTATYYSSFTNQQTAINTFSGLTISDPTANSSVSDKKTETNWYKATH